MKDPDVQKPVWVQLLPGLLLAAAILVVGVAVSGESGSGCVVESVSGFPDYSGCPDRELLFGDSSPPHVFETDE